MLLMNKKSTNQKIKELVVEAGRLVKNMNLRQDSRGEWFSNNQLNDLRWVLERKGINTAIVFQAGRLDKSKRRIDQIKNQILLDLLRFINRQEIGLDLRTSAYVIGKINYLLAAIQEEDLR